MFARAILITMVATTTACTNQLPPGVTQRDADECDYQAAVAAAPVGSWVDQVSTRIDIYRRCIQLRAGRR